MSKILCSACGAPANVAGTEYLDGKVGDTPVAVCEECLRKLLQVIESYKEFKRESEDD